MFMKMIDKFVTNNKYRWAAVILAFLLFLIVYLVSQVNNTANADYPIDADGSTDPCVNNYEFNHIDPGASKTRVKKEFDYPGVLLKPTKGSAIYNDLEYYGAPVVRVPMQYREVRQYPICLHDHVVEGYVRVVFDTRGAGKKLDVGEMVKYVNPYLKQKAFRH